MTIPYCQWRVFLPWHLAVVLSTIRSALLFFAPTATKRTFDQITRALGILGKCRKEQRKGYKCSDHAKIVSFASDCRKLFLFQSDQISADCTNRFHNRSHECVCDSVVVQCVTSCSVTDLWKIDKLQELHHHKDQVDNLEGCHIVTHYVLFCDLVDENSGPRRTAADRPAHSRKAICSSSQRTVFSLMFCPSHLKMVGT